MLFYFFIVGFRQVLFRLNLGILILNSQNHQIGSTPFDYSVIDKLDERLRTVKSHPLI